MQVYGADKVWKQMVRDGMPVARCTVKRLMKRMGLHGVRRGKVVRTTVPDKAVPCPLDRVHTASSRLIVPTSYGCRTSPMSRLDRAGSTWPL